MKKSHKNGSEVNENSEALRAEIDETRERLSSDIDALGNKLSPQNIKAEAKQAIKQTFHHGADQVRETMSTAGGSLLTAVKENPLPLALIGLGIGWLVLNQRNASSKASARHRPDYAVAGRAGVYDPQEPAGFGVEDANSKLHELGERTRAGVESVKRVASDTLHQAHDQLDKAKTAARDGVRKTQETAVNAMEENPLLLGALTLGVGVAVGLSIPSTESEDKLVGQYRDRLLTKAKEKASGLAEIAKETARSAAESGARSARKQLSEAGISSESSP